MSDNNIKAIAEIVGGAVKVKRSARGGEPVKNDGMPDGCPVTPLGRRDNIFYYMDANRQLAALSADKHGHLNLKALFAPHTQWCEVQWPRWSKPDKDGNSDIIGTDWARVSDALMNACAAIGPIDLDKRVRAAGAWVHGDGRLVVHCGDKVFIGADQVILPGRIGDHIYPAAAQIPQPMEGYAGTEAAAEVLAALKSWHWTRPDIDPHLMLGWIGAAMVGGALEWRPLVWVTGDKATGKSTLQKMIKYIFTDAGLVYSADATEAGIRQTVGRSSLPVALDELEAEEDNRRGNNIVKLARIACSSNQSLRGGADHKGSAFSLLNCFMFSSILIPPMLGQDVSRMAVLELKPLEDAMAPTLKPDHYKKIGQIFRRRFLERWADFEKILALYRQALAAQGHTGRSADQFGTLYACHDVLIYDGVPPKEIIEDVAVRLKYSGLRETSDDLADWERCIAHLMAAKVDFYRGGERKSVGTFVMQAANMINGGDAGEANRALANYGMRVRRVGTGAQGYYALLVANAHSGLNDLFKDTHWCGRSGADGVWAQSMRRVPDAKTGGAPTTFAGAQSRYAEIPVQNILKKEECDFNDFAS